MTEPLREKSQRKEINADLTLDELVQGLDESGYVVDTDLAVPLHLMTDLGRPLLLEGDAGVGKTELASALARFLKTKLIRLQCYEGLDAHSAIYEWNYQRQLLEIRLHQSEIEAGRAHEVDLYREELLLKRPLLQSITEDIRPVLLIDEIDRADEEFEAFLLEILSDFQITIPEFGTIEAKVRPYVILTSNGTRELSDALRRRCLYAFVDYPTAEREAVILAKHIPNMDEKLIAQVVALLAKIRLMDLRKRPGVAEAIDWAQALLCLNVQDLQTIAGSHEMDQVEKTLSCLLKTRDDQARVSLHELLRAG